MRAVRCLLLVSAMLSAAMSLSLSAAAHAEDAALTKQFRDLLDSEWEYTLRESPTFASHLGDKRYNDRWPDASLGAIERRHQHKQELLAKLDKVKLADLPSADRLNYQLFRKEVSESLEEFAY